MPEPTAALKKVKLITDGSCLGNPGPGGWGALLRRGAIEKELFGGEKLPDNPQLGYGIGFGRDMYVNLSDDAGMAAPVFGPLPIQR